MTNLAVPGWTLWQQHLAVTARLAGTPDRPQVVVFYGGFEDVAGTLVSASLRGPDDPFPAMLTSEDVIAFQEGDTDVTDAGGGAALGRRAAERFLGLQGVIETQLSAQDIRTLFVLEPDALAADPGGSGPMATGWHRDLADRGGFAAAMDAARTVLGSRVVDLRGLLTDQPRPVFSDLVNTNEDGAAAGRRRAPGRDGTHPGRGGAVIPRSVPCRRVEASGRCSGGAADPAGASSPAARDRPGPGTDHRGAGQRLHHHDHRRRP